MNDTLFQVAALVIPLVIAIVFHEVAHGWTARLLGDPTAAQLGRLSLNPIKHVDPFGTIILPGMLKLAGLPVFGWAKSVPVIKGRLRNPRRDMMIVAATGPGSNLVMALFGAVALGLVIGGALGNVIDRIRFGAVADFLDLNGLWFPWVFNVADAAITVGAILLAVDMVFLSETEPGKGTLWDQIKGRMSGQGGPAGGPGQ